MAKSNLIEILVVGQTPPPWHGQAAMIQEFLNGRYQKLQVHHLRMAYSNDLTQVGRFNLQKVLHLFELIYRTIEWRLRIGPCYLFYPPAGPNLVPILRDIVYLLCTRWMFRGTIFFFQAAGVSERVTSLPAPLRFLANLAYRKVICAVRPSSFNPDDPGAFEARNSFEIPNAVPDQALKTLGPSLGKEKTRVRDAHRILFVGVMNESKGTLIFLDAILLLLESGYSVEADMVGEIENPAVRAEIERRMAHPKLKQAVTLRGRLVGDAKWNMFRAADIFVFPTFYESESFGLVLVEAMEFGLPVVSTRWRGVQSVVADGETGFLVQIKDPAAVAERIALLIREPQRAAKMGAAGRRRFEAHYTVERFWERMEAAILKSVSS
jgi:glycosyltransferase involved in cell wall biosynthesis